MLEIFKTMVLTACLHLNENICVSKLCYYNNLEIRTIIYIINILNHVLL